MVPFTFTNDLDPFKVMAFAKSCNGGFCLFCYLQIIAHVLANFVHHW